MSNVPKGDVARWRQALVLIDELQEILDQDFLFSMNGFLDEGAEAAAIILSALDKEMVGPIGGPDDEQWICQAAGCFLTAKNLITNQLRWAESRMQSSTPASVKEKA